MNEQSGGEILEAINAFSERMDTRLMKIETRLSTVEDRLSNVESTMVTKDHLDTVVLRLHDQLLNVDKKVNARMTEAVEVLDREKVLKPADTAKLLAMDPLPQS